MGRDLYGAGPEHPLVEKLTTASCRQAVNDYRYQAARQSEVERLSTEKEKTGVFIGAYAINPVNGAKIPIWIADYVLMTYGTGAIMAVPAHDERDLAFAIKYALPVIPVIERTDGLAKSIVRRGAVREGLGSALYLYGIAFEERDGALYVTLKNAAQIDAYIEQVRKYLLPQAWFEIVGARWEFIFGDHSITLDSVEADQSILARCQVIVASQIVEDAYAIPARTTMEMLYSHEFYRDALFHAEYGAMINSGQFTGTPGNTAKANVTQWLERRKLGGHAVNYRLRDWLISRQRYWGAPIPMIYCDKCGIVPVHIRICRCFCR
jgi:leucyl-tRNA synthetase